MASPAAASPAPAPAAPAAKAPPAPASIRSIRVRESLALAALDIIKVAGRCRKALDSDADFLCRQHYAEKVNEVLKRVAEFLRVLADDNASSNELLLIVSELPPLLAPLLTYARAPESPLAKAGLPDLLCVSVQLVARGCFDLAALA